jgi:hypothetical protein
MDGMRLAERGTAPRPSVPRWSSSPRRSTTSSRSWRSPAPKGCRSFPRTPDAARRPLARSRTQCSSDRPGCRSSRREQSPGRVGQGSSGVRAECAARPGGLAGTSPDRRRRLHARQRARLALPTLRLRMQQRAGDGRRDRRRARRPGRRRPRARPVLGPPRRRRGLRDRHRARVRALSRARAVCGRHVLAARTSRRGPRGMAGVDRLRPGHHLLDRTSSVPSSSHVRRARPLVRGVAAARDRGSKNHCGRCGRCGRRSTRSR